MKRPARELGRVLLFFPMAGFSGVWGAIAVTNLPDYEVALGWRALVLSALIGAGILAACALVVRNSDGTIITKDPKIRRTNRRRISMAMAIGTLPVIVILGFILALQGGGLMQVEFAGGFTGFAGIFGLLMLYAYFTVIRPEEDARIDRWNKSPRSKD
jgi:hypothetical protein